MPRFPLKESEILALARRMIAGFREHPRDFPALVVPLDQMERELAEAAAGLHAAGLAVAAARQATADKDGRFKRLTRTMSRNLRGAEIQAREDPRLLLAIGWAPRRPKRPIRPPGEVRELRIVEEEESAIVLRWKKPVDGGRPATYRVVRRLPGRGRWEEVGSSVTTRVRLEQQEQGVAHEYRVLALNKAGEGRPSNSVRAVL